MAFLWHSNWMLRREDIIEWYRTKKERGRAVADHDRSSRGWRINQGCAFKQDIREAIKNHTMCGIYGRDTTALWFNNIARDRKLIMKSGVIVDDFNKEIRQRIRRTLQTIRSLRRMATVRMPGWSDMPFYAEPNLRYVPHDRHDVFSSELRKAEKAGVTFHQYKAHMESREFIRCERLLFRQRPCGYWSSGHNDDEDIATFYFEKVEDMEEFGRNYRMDQIKRKLYS